MDLIQLFYVSCATTPYDDEVVRSVLQVSRRNNDLEGLTGCLLFSGRYFAQVLEGPREAASRKVARISADPRHSDIRLLVEREVPQREYANWSMDYLYDLTLEDQLEAMLLDPVPSSQMVEIMDRMRPDAVMGSLS